MIIVVARSPQLFFVLIAEVRLWIFRAFILGVAQRLKSLLAELTVGGVLAELTVKWLGSFHLMRAVKRGISERLESSVLSSDARSKAWHQWAARKLGAFV